MEKDCIICGKIFFVKPYRYETQRCCSKACAAKNKRPLDERFREKYKVDNKTGCWMWTSTVCGNGYGHIWDNGKQEKAHRISWEIHNGKIPEGMVICHKCDTPLCVNPYHLFVGTVIDNIKDRDKKNRQAKGEKQGISVLTDETAKQILKAEGKQEDIAERYGTTQQQVSRIKNRKTWKHIDAGHLNNA